jgi:hypothetical protein
MILDISKRGDTALLERIKLSKAEVEKIAMKLSIAHSLSADLSEVLSPKNARKLKPILKNFGANYEQIVSPQKNKRGDQYYLIIREPSQGFYVRLSQSPLLLLQRLAGDLGLPTEMMIEKIVEHHISSEKLNTALKKWVGEQAPPSANRAATATR